MSNYGSKIWNKPYSQRLSFIMSNLETEKDLQKFLTDVMTEKEIQEISYRLEAAYLLYNETKYTDVISKTKLSSKTVARISDWIKNGAGGYKLAFKILKQKDHL